MFKNGSGYKFEVDVDQLLVTPTNTADFEEIHPTSVSKALNEVVDTFFRLSDEGYAQNVLTALDPQYDLTVKGDSTDDALNAILDVEFDIPARNRNVIKITDNFSGKSIEVGATITAISDSREIESVIEFSFSFKFRGKPTISTVSV